MKTNYLIYQEILGGFHVVVAQNPQKSGSHHGERAPVGPRHRPLRNRRVLERFPQSASETSHAALGEPHLLEIHPTQRN